jgi:hypothetical protein
MLMRSAGSSMDRASDYGSEGWGFDSLPARYQGAFCHHRRLGDSGPGQGTQAPQHADQYRPERPVLLAVDQELSKGARLSG